MESLKELVQCEKLTNRKTLQKQSGKSFEIVYSGEKKDEIESFKFLKQKSLFGQLSSRCYDQQSLVNMFLTGKEDSKKENIDSILNMSFKLHSSIDQSIGEFQKTRKELKVLKDEHSRKEDVVPVSLSHIITLLRRMDSMSFLQYDESLRKQIMMVILPQLVKLVDHKSQSLKFLRKQKISLASRILDLEKTASQIEGFPWEDAQHHAISDYCTKLHNSTRDGKSGQWPADEHIGAHFVSIPKSNATNDEIC